MISFEEFRRSLERPEPPAELPAPIAALWHAAVGDWDTGHSLVCEMEGPDAAWVHAHLHRTEGDPGNAAYWYRQAGKPVSTASLDDERLEIARALIERAGTG